MFTQTSRTILQLFVVVILMSAGVTKAAHANVIGLDAPDPRTLKYVCCNAVDLTKNAGDHLPGRHRERGSVDEAKWLQCGRADGNHRNYFLHGQAV